jgi:hypothetical protein
MPTPKSKIAIIVALIIIFLEIVLILFPTGPRRYVNASLLLSYNPPADTSHISERPADLVLTAQTMLVDITMLIPHTPLRQTRYEVSLVTPTAQHVSLPSLYPSKQGSMLFDTLRVTIDKKYFHGPSGRYTFVLTEIFMEDPGKLSPGIYLYPFRMTSN